VTPLLDYLNWDGWGISPEAWEVVMLAAGAAIASAVSLKRGGDVAYVLVIVWAFIGIAVKHADTPIVWRHHDSTSRAASTVLHSENGLSGE